MLMRVVCCVVGWALLAGPVVAQAPPAEEATKAEVQKLRAQAQALLAQAQALELQARAAKLEREAAEKYMRELAESCLDALLKGESDALLPVMTEELKEQFLVDKKNVQNRQNLNVVRRRGGIAVADYKITRTVIAPSFEEAIFRAEIRGTSTIPKDKGKAKAATVTLRVQKANGRYVIGFLNVVIEK